MPECKMAFQAKRRHEAAGGQCAICQDPGDPVTFHFAKIAFNSMQWSAVPVWRSSTALQPQCVAVLAADANKIVLAVGDGQGLLTTIHVRQDNTVEVRTQCLTYLFSRHA